MAQSRIELEELKQGFAHYPPIMTSQDVAEMLAMNIQEVRRLVREGRLPARRIGKAYRFFRDELILWLYEREPDRT
jgi:excisionase family DNA binding protein